jgi:glycosyltransferase involved in cell wall biosynthesis
VSEKLKVVCFSLGGAGVSLIVEIAKSFKRSQVEFHFYSGESVEEQSSSVQFHNKVEFTEMIDILKASDVVLNFDEHTDQYFEKLESQYSLHKDERFDFVNCKSGLKYYNAAYTECVFISTPNPTEYSELVNNTETGFICSHVSDFVDVITSLKSNSAKVLDVKRKAKQDVISKYSLTTLVLDYLNYIKSVEES